MEVSGTGLRSMVVRSMIEDPWFYGIGWRESVVWWRGEVGEHGIPSCSVSFFNMLHLINVTYYILLENSTQGIQEAHAPAKYVALRWVTAIQRLVNPSEQPQATLLCNRQRNDPKTDLWRLRYLLSEWRLVMHCMS